MCFSKTDVFGELDNDLFLCFWTCVIQMEHTVTELRKSDMMYKMRLVCAVAEPDQEMRAVWWASVCP